MPSERIQRRIDSLLDEADEAVREHQWTVVRERAQSALTLDPENADALAYLAAAERAPGPNPPASSQAAGGRRQGHDSPNSPGGEGVGAQFIAPADGAPHTAELSAAEPPPAGAALPGESATSSAPTVPEAQPTSFVGGRYIVKRFLGEGGKKKVYLAHDVQLDRDVAFALIKTEGLDEALTISRELGIRPLLERVLSRREILKA